MQQSQRILFLDDSPVRARAFTRSHPEAAWVKSAAQCVERLGEPWDEVHLDYDLGWGAHSDTIEESGMGVVNWIVDHKPEHLRATSFIVHSHNRNASERMVRELASAGYYAIRRPFDDASGD